jgi:nucleotide-binding universal stress UspA family protein
MELQRILFPTDFSEASAEALERAAVLAARTGAQLRIFHCESPHAHAPHQVARQRRELLTEIGRIRRRWPAELQDRSDVVVDTGRSLSAYEGIMADVAEYRPDLVVMATHGGGLFMGSVAEQVVGNAPCNVLTCRLHAQGAWPLGNGRILVPIDFSDDAKRALEAARSIADGSPITLVHVVDAPQPAAPHRHAMRLPFGVDPEVADRIREHLRDWANGPVDAVSVVQGDIRATLLDEIRNHDAALVVVGARHMRTVSQCLLGSTAERLVRDSAAPVLVVRNA